MEVLTILGVIAAVALIGAGLYYLNEHCKQTYRYSPFNLGVFGFALLPAGCIALGVWTLDDSAGGGATMTLNTGVLWLIALCSQVGLGWYLVGKTNLPIGVFTSLLFLVAGLLLIVVAIMLVILLLRVWPMLAGGSGKKRRRRRR